MLLPRCTYLPSLVNRALDHFRVSWYSNAARFSLVAIETCLLWQHVLPPEVKDAVNTPWFEDDGLPLRW